MEVESTTRSEPDDSIEQTSDNYGQKKIGSFKKLLPSKRKACDEEKTGPDNKSAQLDSSTDSITVNIKDKDVVIEVRCLWRDSVFLEVMEVITKLSLDLQTVRSSCTDGIFSMSIKAKVCHPHLHVQDYQLNCIYQLHNLTKVPQYQLLI